jgi:hypothetical protein
MSKKESILYYCRKQFTLIGQLKELNEEERLKVLLSEIKQKLSVYDNGELRDIPLIILQVADWVIDYVNGRQVDYDVIFENVINAINEHLQEYCYNSSSNRKAFSNFSEQVDIASLLSRAIQGEIFIDPLEMEAVHFARFPLLKKSIEKIIDVLCEKAQKEREIAARKAETEKYLNKQGGKLSDRVEPIITKVIDLLIDKLANEEELDISELNKLLNTILTPVAKMRGELIEGKVEINAHSLFVNLMNYTATAADAKRVQGQILEIESNVVKELT